jgi:hypothetical protein
MANFNINALALQDTTVLHLQGPDGTYLYADEAEKEPLEIEVYGRSSKQMRNYLIGAEKKKAKRGKRVATPEESQEDNAEFFAAITKSIRNFDLGNGPLTTQAHFKELYMNPALYWITDILSENLGNTESFMQK